MKGFYYETKLGKIFLAEDGHGITEVTLVKDPNSPEDKNSSKRKSISNYELEETPLIRQTMTELTEYFYGRRTEFSISLNPEGTEFQKKVWEALRAIPYGETRSYQEIAEAVGNKKASRAVGMANHHNPIMCIIPCHRVIGAKGTLVGYAGGLDKKAALLTLEQNKRLS